MKYLIILLTIIYTIGLGYFIIHFHAVNIMLISATIAINIGIYIIYKRFNAILNQILVISIVLFIFISAFLGTGLGFYTIFNWYDEFLHFTSGIIITFLGYNIILWFDRKHLTDQLNRLFIVSYVLLFNLGLASIWEIYEYSVDQLFGMNSQLGSLDDTMHDMIYAFIASLVTVCLFEIKRFIEKKKTLKE